MAGLRRVPAVGEPERRPRQPAQHRAGVADHPSARRRRCDGAASEIPVALVAIAVTAIAASPATEFHPKPLVGGRRLARGAAGDVVPRPCPGRAIRRCSDGTPRPRAPSVPGDCARGFCTGCRRVGDPLSCFSSGLRCSSSGPRSAPVVTGFELRPGRGTPRARRGPERGSPTPRRRSQNPRARSPGTEGRAVAACHRCNGEWHERGGQRNHVTGSTTSEATTAHERLSDRYPVAGGPRWP